jgi:glucose/arabinose dehydrogenase
MTPKSLFIFTLLTLLNLLAPAALAQDAPKPWSGTTADNVPKFKVRAGYRVSLASAEMDETRFLEIDPATNTLFVSQPRAGKIIALKDENNDGVYDHPTDLVTGKKRAHGMQFKDGWLWFSTTGSINKARDTNGDGKADEVVAVIPDGQLPKDGGHWFRSILVTDEALYTSIGDSGNIDDPENPEKPADKDRQKIWKYDLEGKNRALFAGGIRNTEKLRIRPGTSDMYGCDHGSDMFGGRYGEIGGPGKQPITDLMPPCEFNLYQEGKFYGHPYVVGNRVPRMEYFQKMGDKIVEIASRTTPPAWCFGAHWAPNGWCFLTKDSAIGKRGDAIVAFHGSWNSTEKVGYRIEKICFDPETNRPYGTQTLVYTLNQDGKNFLARPVDCIELPNGDILWSCDETKKVYRLSPTK